MKNNLFIYRNRKFPGELIFLVGFVTGIILPNLMFKMKWRQETASALYLLGIYAGEGGVDYVGKVIKMRAGIFLLAAGSGLTIFGIPVAVVGVLMTGINLAMLLTMSILQFGLQGGLIGVCLLFPQWVLYLPCIMAGCGIVYESSVQIWKNRTFFPGHIVWYLIKVMVCAVCFVVGILLEIYCNPIITKIMIQNLKIF